MFHLFFVLLNVFSYYVSHWIRIVYFISVKPGNTGVPLHAGLLIIPCTNKTLDVTATGSMLLMQGLSMCKKIWFWNHIYLMISTVK